MESIGSEVSKADALLLYAFHCLSEEVAKQ